MSKSNNHPKGLGRPRSMVASCVKKEAELDSKGRDTYCCKGSDCTYTLYVAEGKPFPSSVWNNHIVCHCTGFGVETKLKIARHCSTMKVRHWLADREHNTRNEYTRMQSPSAVRKTTTVSCSADAVDAADAAVGPTRITNDTTTSSSGASSTPLPATYIHENTRRQLQDEKYQTVKSWLQDMLPDLYLDDVDAYAGRLVNDGFDTKSLLEEELDDDDLGFMKKAHRRKLWKQILEDRGEMENNTSTKDDDRINLSI